MSKSFRIALYLLFFGLLSAYATFFRHPLSVSVSKEQILGANADLELFIQPEAGRKPIVSKIDQARQNVLVGVYLLSDSEVISALERAFERGVQVKVSLEKHPFGGGNLNNSTFDQLNGAGVSISWSNPSFALTHEKVMIIDDTTVCILNQNLTTSAFERNREYDICDQNPQDVFEANAVFAADWNRKSFTPSSSNLVISPQTARSKLMGLISSAKNSIDLEMEIVEDRDIIDLLSKSAANLPVRMILPDFGKVPSNQIAAEKLKAAGVEIKTLASPYLHAKLITVDQDRAYVGSVNLSTQSLDQNREMGIIVSQGDITDGLAATFQQDWAKAISY